MWIVKFFAHGDVTDMRVTLRSVCDSIWRRSSSATAIWQSLLCRFWNDTAEEYETARRDEAVVDGVRIALRRQTRQIAVGGKEARLSNDQLEMFQLLMAAGASGVTYADLGGTGAPSEANELLRWRRRVHTAVSRLNKKLVTKGIPLEVRPLSKNEYVLTASRALNATQKRRYVAAAPA